MPATILLPPTAPAIGTATAGVTSASVAFTPDPNNGGSPVTLYTVTSSPSGIQGTGAASPITVNGLTAGTPYTFRVTATNVLGTSLPSGVSNSATPSSSGGGGTIFFQEDYNTYPSGNVSLTSPYTSRGYVDITASVPASIQNLTRAGMPAGLLADPNFPASKTRCNLFTLGGLEDQSLLNWSGFPNSSTRIVSYSWWEYRNNGNFGNEKLCRVGNYVGGGILNNRGIDAVISIQTDQTYQAFANSANMHDYPQSGMGSMGSWPPGLNHFEVVYSIPSDTSATGTIFWYVNNVQTGSYTNVQFFDTSGQAAFGFQLWDMGGWASGAGTFPILRYFCAARIASTRQGQWAMSAV